MFDKILKSSLYGLATIFLVVFFHYLGWLAPAENLMQQAISPVVKLGYDGSHSLGGFYQFWLARRDLANENWWLKYNLAKQAVDTAKLQALSDENDLLKKELNFVEEKKTKFVAAKIVTGVSDPLTKSVVINRGSRDGIEPGLAVVADSGVIIGKISEVSTDYSKVLLLTDNKSSLAATVQNVDHTVGLVEGQYGLSFSMTNIPQNQEIKAGDLVVTSGLEGKIPKALLVAKVESVKSVSSEIFKTAILSAIVPFDNLSDVLVIIP